MRAVVYFEYRLIFIIEYDVFLHAGASGDVELVKWLHSNYGFNKDNKYELYLAMCGALWKSHVGLARKLFEQIKGVANKAHEKDDCRVFETALKRNSKTANIEYMRLVNDIAKIIGPDFGCEYPLYGDDEGMLEICLQIRDIFTVFESAARCGNIQLLEKLIDRFIDNDTYYIEDGFLEDMVSF